MNTSSIPRWWNLISRWNFLKIVKTPGIRWKDHILLASDQKKLNDIQRKSLNVENTFYRAFQWWNFSDWFRTTFARWFPNNMRWTFEVSLHFSFLNQIFHSHFHGSCKEPFSHYSHLHQTRNKSHEKCEIIKKPLKRYCEMRMMMDWEALLHTNNSNKEFFSPIYIALNIHIIKNRTYDKACPFEYTEWIFSVLFHNVITFFQNDPFLLQPQPTGWTRLWHLQPFQTECNSKIRKDILK